MRSILDTTKAQQECAEAAIEEARSNDSLKGKRSKYFMHPESKKTQQERPEAAIEEARSSDRQPLECLVLECFDLVRGKRSKRIRKQKEDKWKREKIDELEREAVRLEKLLLEGEAMGEELVVVLEGVKNVYYRAEIEGIVSDFYSLKQKKSVRKNP